MTYERKGLPVALVGLSGTNLSAGLVIKAHGIVCLSVLCYAMKTFGLGP